MIGSVCMIQPPHPAQRCHLRGTMANMSKPTQFEGWPGPCMVTDMVNVRKLIWELMRNFPHPVPTWVRKPVLQINGLLARVSASGRFEGTKSCQILPFFTKNVHGRGANGQLRVN